MHYCVNNTIVTNVTKISKVEQVTNVIYGVMCVEEKTVRKKNNSRICPDCNKEVRSESCYIAYKLEKKRKGTNIMLPSLCETKLAM